MTQYLYVAITYDGVILYHTCSYSVSKVHLKVSESFDMFEDYNVVMFVMHEVVA